MQQISEITDTEAKDLLEYLKKDFPDLKKNMDTGVISYKIHKQRGNKPIDIVANCIRASYPKKDDWWQAHYLLYVVPKESLPLYINTEWGSIAHWRMNNGI